MEHELHLQMKAYYGNWRRLNALYEVWARRHGIGMYALFTLYALWERDGACTLKYIAEAWCLPKQTVHSILKKWEEQGLVAPAVAAADKRSRVLSLTPAGRVFADRLLGELTGLEEQVMGRMGAGLCTEMNRLDQMFCDYFEEGMEEGV